MTCRTGVIFSPGDSTTTSSSSITMTHRPHKTRSVFPHLAACSSSTMIRQTLRKNNNHQSLRLADPTRPDSVSQPLALFSLSFISSDCNPQTSLDQTIVFSSHAVSRNKWPVSLHLFFCFTTMTHQPHKTRSVLFCLTTTSSAITTIIIIHRAHMITSMPVRVLYHFICSSSSVHHFQIGLFSALEQTQCTRVTCDSE